MATKGIRTDGAKFSFGHYNPRGVPSDTKPTTLTEVYNILRMPSLGGEVQKIEVTTLADTSIQYIPGLRDYGDMEFTLLFDNSDGNANYRVLNDLGTEIVWCVVELGDKLLGTKGTTFGFDAILTPSVDEQEPNQAIQFTLNCALQSNIRKLSDPE